MQFKIADGQRKSRGVYRITNEANGKVYLGSAERLWPRWQGHAHKLRGQKHPNKHLQAAFDAYGEEAFVFEVATEVAQDEDLLAAEQHYLDAYMGSGCYNLCATAGSCKGVKRSQETRRKQSANQRARMASLDARAAISRANTGRTRTLEERALMSRLATGRFVSMETRQKLSKRPTQETRDKMSLAQKAAWVRRKEANNGA